MLIATGTSTADASCRCARLDSTVSAPSSELDPLAHPDEAEPPSPLRPRVEARAVVLDHRRRSLPSLRVSDDADAAAPGRA